MWCQGLNLGFLHARQVFCLVCFVSSPEQLKLKIIRIKNQTQPHIYPNPHQAGPNASFLGRQEKGDQAGCLISFCVTLIWTYFSSHLCTGAFNLYAQGFSTIVSPQCVEPCRHMLQRDLLNHKGPVLNLCCAQTERNCEECSQ